MLEDVDITLNRCRLCQINIGTRLLDSEEFVNKVIACTNIQINDNLKHYLPKSICSQCELNITNFYTFLQKIRLVDKDLRKKLTNIPLEVLNSSSHFTKENAFNEQLCITCSSSANKLYIKSADCVEYNVKETLHQNQNECSHHNTFQGILIGNGDEPCLLSANKLTETINKGDVINENFPIKDDACEDLHVSKDVSLEEKETYSCELYNKHFRLSSDLYNHMSNFVCKYSNCKRVCSSAYSLKTHLTKHQGKTPFLCVTCGKSFITKNSLTCHEKIHTSIKKYSCKECNIGFSVSSNLRAHQRKHHEGIRFYCSQCPRTFIAKCSLQRHELLHTGIKEFKCHLCSAEFYTSKELIKHQRYHQGVRSYKCDRCFKTFFEKHHLTIHMRCHTGERPYLCTIANCNRAFTESQKLTRHMKARHVVT